MLLAFIPYFHTHQIDDTIYLNSRGITFLQGMTVYLNARTIRQHCYQLGDCPDLFWSGLFVSWHSRYDRCVLILMSL